MSSLPVVALYQSHPRSFESNRFIYPVLSRRAGGMSIGINLNPEKSCNFDCVYCQVDRSQRGAAALRRDDLPQLASELEEMLDLITSGRIFEETKFRDAPAALRRLNDMAFSGDGEPTSSPLFGDVVNLCVETRRRRQLDAVKIVVITNATMLHREPVRRALEILDANNGEVWGKLDAGTEDYYQQIDRSKVPLAQILDNLRQAATVRPIVIQTLFMRVDGQGPPAAELDAYCTRLQEIVAAGGRIKLVQIHTVARPPAESCVTPLSNDEIDAAAELVRRRTGLSVAAFYGYVAQEVREPSTARSCETASGLNPEP